MASGYSPSATTAADQRGNVVLISKDILVIFAPSPVTLFIASFFSPSKNTRVGKVEYQPQRHIVDGKLNTLTAWHS